MSRWWGWCTGWMVGLLVGLVSGGAVGPLPTVAHPAQARPAAPAVQPAVRPATSPRPVQGTVSRWPLVFEANQGQTETQVKFLARGRGYTLFLTATEAVWVFQAPSTQDRVPGPRERGRAGGLEPGPAASPAPNGPTQERQPTVLRMPLVGANLAPQLIGREALPGQINVLRGNDPARWRTKIPTYARVRYREVYPGVDLVFYRQQGQVEYDFVVAPGADPQAIRLSFQDQAGHPYPLRLDPRGDLVINTMGGELRLRQPGVYQDSHGVRTAIPSQYVVHTRPPSAATETFPLQEGDGQGEGHEQIGFQVAAYDTRRPLIIDPILSYATFLGGRGIESGNSIAVDAAGSAYVTGYTASPDFPTKQPVQPTPGGDFDAFVAKLAPDGSALVYATYLGGSDYDNARGIAVDTAGAAYVIGDTSSPDFPTKRPLQRAYSGGGDAFVAKLAPDGSALVYATYFGGRHIEDGLGIAVDAAGHAYVTGETHSLDFPIKNALQPTCQGCPVYFDAFVAKLTPDGSAFVFSTYLGGSSAESGSSIAVDATGHAYVTGQTSSADFPTAQPFQPVHGALADAFVTKLTPDGDALVYSTYLGGNGGEAGTGIAVDGAGHAYVTGDTWSADFPIKAAVQPVYGGGFWDAFVAKLTPAGTALVYSTYLGGSRIDRGLGIAVDGAEQAVVTGVTESADFPTQDAVQARHGGRDDAFVVKLTPDGTALVYATFLGGSSYEDGLGVAVDPTGQAYVTGDSYSYDFPLVNPLQPRYGDFIDAFVVKLADTAPPCQGTGPYRLRGRVQAGTTGVKGVTLTLSGPGGCQETTRTRRTGRYRFPQLGAGTYTVTPRRLRCVFTPPTDTVTLAGADATARVQASCL